MGWLIVTEYAARILPGGYAQFNSAAPLVEQRMEICDRPTRSRAFSIKTSLIAVRADSACLIEIDNPSVSADLAGGAYEHYAVIPGGHLTVIEDALVPVTKELS